MKSEGRIRKPNASELPAHDGRFKPATEQVEQDWGRLQEYLATHGYSLSLETKPRQFASGLANLNYLITTDDQQLVLRRPPLGPLPPGANDMRREHKVLSKLWKGFPLAPRSHHFCADTTVIGSEFFIMEYRPGLIIGGEIRSSLQEQRELGALLANHLVSVLTELHNVDPPAIGLDDLGRPQGFLTRQIDGWAKRALLAFDQAPGAPADTIVRWLRAHVPPSQPAVLIHNDFKLDNLVLDEQTLTPVALLDWDMCTRADPLFDLAVLLSYWTEESDPPVMHELRQMPTAAHGFPTRSEIAEKYASSTGRDLSKFIFYRVLAMYRLGVIFKQLYNRYRNGTVNDPRYKTFASLAQGIFDFTLDLIEGQVL